MSKTYFQKRFWAQTILAKIIFQLSLQCSLDCFKHTHTHTHTHTHNGEASNCFYKASVSESEVAQSCPTLCDPMDCSLPGSSVHGILQARVLEWGTIAFARGSSRPRDRTRVSRILGRRFNL